MLIRNIDIVDFKNIAEANLCFSPGVNCLLGLNGMGKSNLLEAIHLLSMARPMRSVPEAALIRHGCQAMMVKGVYEMENGVEERVSCGIVRGKGKTLRRNDKEYPRISEHIGKFPVVTVSPSDTELVTGSGEVRRKLMDVVISQSDPTYLARLIRYNKALESRNKMLRAGVNDVLLYESIETVMCDMATSLHEARRQWVEEMTPDFAHFYSSISGDAEKATMSYKSCLTERTMREVLGSERARDLALGFTSQGIHRDDLAMQLDSYSMRRLGSQGQIKTFTIALKFAIYDFLRSKAGEKPVLLLDDIFDKLDSGRVSRIMETVSAGDSFGQIFITDTNREHLDETLGSLRSESRVYEVEDGHFDEKA
jgi:DNA replication and repair protein RecF